MAIPAVVAGIAAAAPTIVGGLSALWNNSSQNKNLRWQKWAQGVTWQREDNAIQRRVNDLRMAGLSPVLAAGQAAETSPPVRTEAPQLDISPALQASTNAFIHESEGGNSHNSGTKKVTRISSRRCQS